MVQIVVGVYWCGVRADKVLHERVGKILESPIIFKRSTHWIIDFEWTRGLPHANTDYFTKSRV